MALQLYQQGYGSTSYEFAYKLDNTNNYLYVSYNEGSKKIIINYEQTTKEISLSTLDITFEISENYLYKVKNNSLCNYILTFIISDRHIIIIPLYILNNENFTLVECESVYNNYFLFEISVNEFYKQIIDTFDGSKRCLFYAIFEVAIFIEFIKNNNKLLINLSTETSNYNGICFFNGEDVNSNNFKLYYIDNTFQMYDKEKNLINDNGFFSYIIPILPNSFFGYLSLYKNYLIMYPIIDINEKNRIFYCLIDDTLHKVTEYGEVENLEYTGGFFNFVRSDEGFVSLNFINPLSDEYKEHFYTLEDTNTTAFYIMYSEKTGLNFTTWWDSSPIASYTFTEPVTKITYKINKENSSFGKNTIEFEYYSNETLVVHSDVHFVNDYIPYQFILDGKTYQISDDETLQTINGLNITSDQIIIFSVHDYLIRFLDYDNSILETKYVYSGTTPTYTGTTPSREGYTFTGWSPTLYPADKNQDYVAQYSAQTFTIRFLDYDESVLETKQVGYGVTPTYTGTTPSREGYTFTGWSPTLYPADKNQDYTAVYKEDKYTITFEDSSNKDFGVSWWNDLTDEKSREFTNPIVSISSSPNLSPYDNSFFLLLKTGEDTDYMCTIGYSGKNIVPQNFKIGDTTYDIGTNYSVNINSDTTITIVANERYFIRFLNYDNSILETKYVYSGDIPVYAGKQPYQKGYNFTGWNPNLYPADKNQDYVAQFNIQTFTIRFLNEDDSVIETKQVDYNVTPTFTGTEPTKEGYTFIGWNPTLYPANKEQDYKPIFRKNAFNVTLYKNTAENNRVNKFDYLTQVGEIDGYLREETSIVNPVIILEYENVVDFNYVYISTFNRYYFVTEIKSVRTNLWRISLKCDVLMTYRDTILNYECFVARNETDYNEKIEDNYLPLEYDKSVETIKLYNDTFGYGKVFLESEYSIVFTTIYNGSAYHVTESQFETEFQDLNNDILEVSNISLGASNYRCCGIMQNNILDNLNSLIKKTINDDTLSSYIISLIAFPVNGSELTNNYTNPSKLLIKDDTTSIDVKSNDVIYPNAGVLEPILANQFTILPKYNNFLDYEPYTTYELYLPFYGWLKLNSYQILNQQLVVTYIPQVDSEQCTIIVSKGAYVGGSTEVIAEVTCRFGIQIPINSTNLERINREKASNTLNSIVGGISGFAMAGLGVATMNPFLLGGGIATAVGSVTSGISKDMTLLPSAQTQTGTSLDGALGDRVFKLRRTFSKPAVDDITKYSKYIGRPLQTNVKLNTLTGYTIVGGVHIENLGTATDNEKTDIENQLRKGVIL